jgi:hypothetical protein
VHVVQGQEVQLRHDRENKWRLKQCLQLLLVSQDASLPFVEMSMEKEMEDD